SCSPWSGMHRRRCRTTAPKEKSKRRQLPCVEPRTDRTAARSGSKDERICGPSIGKPTLSGVHEYCAPQRSSCEFSRVKVMYILGYTLLCGIFWRIEST